ncbi:GNAT family N-acetyltransferase [Promicromonospora kroppenstedtii]|uniref:GNAT family N-acetyltransferase n=1 Tax=Promicromonospora kroppenstedtii TaxID=440482 RepID=UPI000684D169|nr:GNAT family N-acetyltransferase [Promicromonospora kroppenstedtii]
MRITNFKPRQSKQAAAVAAAAFADDPIWSHVVPDPQRRHLPHTILLRAQLRTIAPSDDARLAEHEGRIVGLAFWSNVWDGEPHDLPDGRRFRAMRRLARSVGDDWPRLSNMYISIGRSIPRDVEWFLATLVVHPEHQGAGIGSALLRDGLKQADRRGHTVILQTSTPENVRFYERHGFEVIEALDELYRGAPPLWTMRRPSTAVGNRIL